MKRSRSLYLLSPASLVIFSWLLTGIAVTFGYAFQDDMLVLTRTIILNRIDFHFPLVGILWIIVSLLVFTVFAFASTRPISPASRVVGHPGDLSQAVRLAALMHGFIVLIVIAWVATGAARLGGLDRLIAMATQNETYEARMVILDNKLFPGMRLLYTGLISLGVFGACVFAANLRNLARVRSDMAIGLGMFLVSALVLSLLPIILSQRILFVHMVLSTFIGVSLVLGRPFRIRYMILLSLLLFVVWSIAEAVRAGEWAANNTGYGAARVGFEKLIYYFVNDFYNAVMPFSVEFPKALGIFTFRFALYFSTLEGEVYQAAVDRMAAIDMVRAGGTFPAFTAPYVDFSWPGIFLTAALAVLFTFVFNRAHGSLTFTVIYAQIGGALIIGPHVAWYTHHNFIFNLMLTVFLCAFIRRRARLGMRERYA